MIRELIFSIENSERALANHLVQSTAFATLIWLLTLVLGKNRARVRHGLWLAASTKFLIPFSLLFALGNLLPNQHQHLLDEPVLSAALTSVGQPFSGLATVPVIETQGVSDHQKDWLPLALVLGWLCGAGTLSVLWGRRWRQVSASLRQAVLARDGRETEILHRVEALVGSRSRVAMFGSLTTMEPGIFGIFRPVMLWPIRLTERLEDVHIESILVHELMHVRRQDNLTAAIHMAVETLFWFHPIVWWIGSRMVLERERACDEATVQLLGKPVLYAESLLKASRFCAESPIVCVSGIYGANLKKRVVRIMSAHGVQSLSPLRRLLLGTVGLMSLTVPVLFGVVHAAGIQNSQTAYSKRLEFAVVSIRQNKAGGPQNAGVPTSDGYEMKNMFVAAPILSAYVPQTGGASAYSDKQVIGLPAWAFSDDDRYNISAKVDEADLDEWRNPDKQPEMLRAMLKAMLADRLKLVVHRGTKDGPVYSLIVGGGGPRFKQSNPVESHPGAHPFPGGGLLSVGREDGEIIVHFFGISIGQLAHSLSADRTVQNNTGLTGKFDVTLRKPLPSSTFPGGAPAPDLEVSPFSLAQQIGLKLVPAEGQVETLVIDHIERPSEN